MSSSTALITFMLHTNPNVYSVEIFGSWDNFDKPYQLARDKRAGEGQWRGCHRFENIVCDGDLSDVSLKREGALMMGGTYWYFYRLNGDLDYHDPKEPFTTFCPSLPGQSVNVLEVPIQDTSSRAFTPNGSSTSIDEVVFTLDPKDKYVPLGVKRAATTSAIQQWKARMLEEEDLGSDEQPETACSIYEGPTLNRQRSLQSVFSILRRTKSTSSSERATATSRSGTSWSRRLFSRASKSRRGKIEDDVPNVPAVPKIPDDVFQLAQIPRSVPATQSEPLVASEKEEWVLVQQTVEAVDGEASPPSASNPSKRNIGVVASPLLSNGDITGSERSQATTADLTRSFRSLALSECQHAGESQARFIEDATEHSVVAKGRTQLEKSTAEEPESDDDHQAGSDFEPNKGKPFIFSRPLPFGPETLPEAGTARFSYTTSESFSPCLTSTYTTTTTSRRMSSIYLSQPETPRMSDFDEEAMVWDRNSDPNFDSNLNDHVTTNDKQSGHPLLTSPLTTGPPHHEFTSSKLPGFQGYSLPTHDHASAITLKKPPSHHDLSRRTSTQQLVESWNDGVEHRLGLPGLVDDLGYLGDWIN